MGKFAELIKNLGLLTLGSFATKLLSFFLVPLYTNVLTTGEYGTYDLVTTTVGILIPILSLNIYEAVLRFAMDEEADREALATIGVKYCLASTLMVALMLIIIEVFDSNLINYEISIYFWMIYFVQTFSFLTSCFARGFGYIKEISVGGVISSASTLLLNITFLVLFHMGLVGYFLANIIGPLIQIVYLSFSTRFLSSIHLFHSYRAKEKELVSYSKPLIINNIAWWINSLSDRYIVVFFCGVAQNGIYSVATKIPTILNVFQQIFNQAWSLSSTKEFDPNDADGFFANTYRAYNCFMTIVCSAVIALDIPLAKILYAKEFYIAWKYVPWLTIGILFGALVGVLEGIFIAVKDSKTPALCTAAGAATNIFLNLILVPTYGALGASVATAICYLEIWITRLICSKKYIALHINLKRDAVSYVLLAIQAITLVFFNEMFIVQLIIGLLVLALYVKDISFITAKLFKKLSVK